MATGTLSPRSACLRLKITMAGPGNGNNDVVMNRNLEIADVSVLCTASDANATMTVSRQALGAGGFNAITNAMACAAASALARTTTITVAEQILANTDVIRCTIAASGGGTANGTVYLDVQALATP